MIAMILAGLLSTVPLPVPGFVEAVGLCTKVAQPQTLQLQPLADAGFVERKIEGIEQARGDDKSVRMFTREGAGAIIMTKVSEAKKSAYCHVLVRGSAKEMDRIERALVPLLGERLPLGPEMTFFKSDQRPWIASLTRKRDGKIINGDIMIMGFDPKEVRAK